MIIREAIESDTGDIGRLLIQICNVHSSIRNDLFKKDGQKYNESQIKEIIADKNRPVIVAFDEEKQKVKGYAMCIITDIKKDSALQSIKTIYLDDLCVDENCRGEGVGKQIYEYLLNYAKNAGCYNLTLNVWEGNNSARRFYENCGMKIQKTTLEQIL